MKKRPAPSLSRGFTLIELLVVISVTGILSAIGIAAFVNYSRQQQVTQAVNDLKNNLRIAQSKALTQEIPSGCSNFSAYELKFADDGKSYTVYPICSGAEGSPKVTTNFPSQVSKVAGEPSKIRFKILTGAVDGAGTIVVCGFNISLAVTVTNVGGIESAPASSTLCPTPTPTPGPVVTPTPIAPTATPVPVSTAYKRVFVTSSGFTGDLGGLIGADAKCQSKADAVSLGGTWKAWLSDGTTSVASRISHATVPYKLVGGTLIANDWNDLTNGDIVNPISKDESGMSRFVWVWTNSKADGMISSASSEGSCNNWTFGSPTGSDPDGRFGGSYANDSQWTQAGTSFCRNYQNLYCFEQ